MTVPSEARVTLEKMLERRRRELASCERMIELLQPEWDKFEARTGHDLYVARDYADHTSAARTHRKEIAALEHALAATAPLLDVIEAAREAFELIANNTEAPLINHLETGFRHSPLTAKEREERYAQAAAFAHQDADAAMEALTAALAAHKGEPK